MGAAALLAGNLGNSKRWGYNLFPIKGTIPLPIYIWGFLEGSQDPSEHKLIPESWKINQKVNIVTKKSLP